MLGPAASIRSFLSPPTLRSHMHACTPEVRGLAVTELIDTLAMTCSSSSRREQQQQVGSHPSQHRKVKWQGQSVVEEGGWR